MTQTGHDAAPRILTKCSSQTLPSSGSIPSSGVLPSSGVSIAAVQRPFPLKRFAVAACFGVVSNTPQ